MLHVPAAVHELDGEPIQQRLVGRHFALAADVDERLRQADAEVPLPQPIDDDAGRERIVAADEPAGQIETIGPPAVDVERRQEVRASPAATIFARVVHPVAARRGCESRAARWPR